MNKTPCRYCHCEYVFLQRHVTKCEAKRLIDKANEIQLAVELAVRQERQRMAGEFAVVNEERQMLRQENRQLRQNGTLVERIAQTQNEMLAKIEEIVHDEVDDIVDELHACTDDVIETIEFENDDVEFLINDAVKDVLDKIEDETDYIKDYIDDATKDLFEQIEQAERHVITVLDDHQDTQSERPRLINFLIEQAIEYYRFCNKYHLDLSHEGFVDSINRSGHPDTCALKGLLDEIVCEKTFSSFVKDLIIV